MIQAVKTFLAVAAGAAALTLAANAKSVEVTVDPERAGVERAVLDYVEGIYEAKPEYIERSVHADLAKYGYARRSKDEPYRGMAMTQAQLKELAATWNADGTKAGADSPKEIEILDMLDQTAAVKLTAAWGIDYMHLAKVDDKWSIVQVLWQTAP